MNKRSVLIFLMAAVLSGCSFYKVDSQTTSSDFFLPKTSLQKVVFLEEASQLHEVIGTVTVTTVRNRPLAEVIDQMRREAAVLGGDAITGLTSNLTPQDPMGRGKRLLGNAGVVVKYTAKVIVFK